MSSYFSKNYSSSQYIIYKIDNISLRHSAESMYLYVTLDSLNEAFKNNKSEDLDHFHVFLYISQENTTSSSLSLLGSTLDPITSTPMLKEPRYEI